MNQITLESETRQKKEALKGGLTDGNERNDVVARPCQASCIIRTHSSTIHARLQDYSNLRRLIYWFDLFHENGCGKV